MFCRGWPREKCTFDFELISTPHERGARRGTEAVAVRSADFVILVAVSRYTEKQRGFCVRAFYENAQCYVIVRRLYVLNSNRGPSVSVQALI